VHIALINHYAGSPNHGMEFRPHQLARRWVQAGHDVTILAASFSHLRNQNPSVHDRVTEEEIDGIRYRWLRTPTYSGNGLGRIRSIHAFLRGVDRERKRFFIDHPPDCVIASSTYPFDIDPAKRLASSFDAPLIWEVHDLWPLSPIELGGYSPRHPFIRAAQRAEDRACLSATKVISILPHAIDHLRTRGLDATRYRWIPNGVSLEDKPRGASPLLAPLGNDGSMVVAYAGGIAETHDLMALLRAAVQLKNEPITFALLGDGPAKARLRAFADKEHLDRVHFFDRMPRNEALAACAGADVMYVGLADHPLYRFGIGLNKIVDAMLLAKPIVAAYSAANDPISDAQCGTHVAAGDVDGVARSLQSMRTADRAVLGAAGHAYVVRHHNYDVLAEDFLCEIESC
jgi:glycosyltransferase involved in cell wall biosynthesis